MSSAAKSLTEAQIQGEERQLTCLEEESANVFLHARRVLLNVSLQRVNFPHCTYFGSKC